MDDGVDDQGLRLEQSIFDLMGNGVAFGDGNSAVDFDVQLDKVPPPAFTRAALFHAPDLRRRCGNAADLFRELLGNLFIHEFADGGF